MLKAELSKINRVWILNLESVTILINGGVEAESEFPEGFHAY